MAIITLRNVVARPLTNQEVDDNFTNLNNESGNTLANVGIVGNLLTASKSNLVSSINEVWGINANLGSLPALTTTVKSNIVVAVNELNTNIGNIATLLIGGNLVNAFNDVYSNTVLDTNITGGNITGLARLETANAKITGGNITGLSTLTASNVTITGGSLLSMTGIAVTGGNVSAQYFLGDGSLLTGVAADTSTRIINGTSFVDVRPDSNIRANVESSTIMLLERVSGVGNITLVGNVIVNPGNVTINNGNLRINNGGIQSASGISVTSGNVVLSAGGIQSSNGISVTSGNLVLSSGGIQSSGGISVTTGNLVLSSGGIQSSAGIAVTTGNLVLSSGGIQTSGGMSITSGNFTISTGDATLSSGSLSVGGNVTVTGSTRRIIGDFSNGTHASRTLVQSSTVNGATSLGVIPNGSSTESSFRAYSTAGVTNSVVGAFLATSDNVIIQSTTTGSASAQPLKFMTGGADRMRIDNGGNVTVLGGTTTLLGRTYSSNFTQNTVSTTVSGTASLDLSLSDIFIVTMTGSPITLTFTNPPSSGIFKNVIVVLINSGGGSKTATFTNAIYTDGTTPTLSTGSGAKDVLSFFTYDGGTSYFGSFIMADVK